MKRQREPELTRYNSKDWETTYKVMVYDPKKELVTYHDTQNRIYTISLVTFSKKIADYEKQ